jgi:hypothetical protein
MSKKINDLSDEQVAQQAVWRDKWIEIGLSTAPANRLDGERAILEMYRVAGLAPPSRIVWCGSPLSQAVTRAIVLDSNVAANVWASVGANVWDSLGDSVRANVWDSVGDSLGDSVWANVSANVADSVRASVRANVRDSVGDSVWASVGNSVGDSVRASVGANVAAIVGDSILDSVRANVWDSVGDSLGDSVWANVAANVAASVRASVGDSVYGQHDSWWLSFYEYFRDVVHLRKETEELAGITLLAKSAGWALPHEKICWVSERHHVLHRDDRGRLHCTTGPAIMYPDGWAIYAIHGVLLPAWIIEEPNRITIESIDKETNAEVRRVMIELFGLGRYVAESAAEVLDCMTVDHAQVGLRGARLLRKNSPLYERPLYFVECMNSSPESDGSFRTYYLSINPEHYGGRAGREAAAALASTWRDPADRSQLIFPRPEDYSFTAES